MVKSIVLSAFANSDRKQILEYWEVRNHSKENSRKLDRIFKENFDLISIYPKIGRFIGIKEIRAIVVKDYLIVYREFEEIINIITIWDTRQNPDKLATRIYSPH